MQSTRWPGSLDAVEGLEEAARQRSVPRAFGALLAGCALCALVAWSGDGSVAAPARAPSLALYVPQVLQTPMVPRAPLSQPAVPQVPQVPQVPMPMIAVPNAAEVPKMQPMPDVREVSQMPPVNEVPSTVVALVQPTSGGPAGPPLNFPLGFAGGFAAGWALVYALVKRTGQKMAPQAMTSGRGRARTGAVVMQLFGGKKKTPEEILEEKGYWPGEWLCADCGYIYEPGTSPPFEELRPKWKCPQCAGPRRRFVKKAGDMVADLDDSPLLYGTAAAAVLIIGLVYIGLTI